MINGNAAGKGSQGNDGWETAKLSTFNIKAAQLNPWKSGWVALSLRMSDGCAALVE